jgi:hypothetical protein
VKRRRIAAFDAGGAALVRGNRDYLPYHEKLPPQKEFLCFLRSFAANLFS